MKKYLLKYLLDELGEEWLIKNQGMLIEFSSLSLWQQILNTPKIFIAIEKSILEMRENERTD